MLRELRWLTKYYTINKLVRSDRTWTTAKDIWI